MGLPSFLKGSNIRHPLGGTFAGATALPTGACPRSSLGNRKGRNPRCRPEFAETGTASCRPLKYRDEISLAGTLLSQVDTGRATQSEMARYGQVCRPDVDATRANSETLSACGHRHTPWGGHAPPKLTYGSPLKHEGVVAVRPENCSTVIRISALSWRHLSNIAAELRRSHTRWQYNNVSIIG